MDPDIESVQHSSQIIGSENCFHGSLCSIPYTERFDLITFNKVLEHVKDPIVLLKQAIPLLEKSSYVYIELPEGQRSFVDGTFAARSEFFIEHFTIFNAQSIKYLAQKAGFSVLKSETYDDPSGKRSIFAFLTKT